MTTLEKIKELKKITGEDADSVLCIMIEDAEKAIMDYCHIRACPGQLEYLVRELVMAAYDNDNGGNVASIKRGDTQINYSSAITTDSFSDRQLRLLNGYRKFRIR